ncbi:GNAT family N-acetyltransferase [Nocardioides campestrisoli]|uniref:GNAT family N-acetyltransferase n=1 Tax=Nocardioides campestrisoli TaxID=2736757 RepID=UPI0015E65176|nr:GNAT family N-acetyltransferase [Nocardioides campestrisoli]
MRLTFEPLDLERDLALLHAWVTHPRSVYWQMQEASLDEVAREYAAIADDPHHDAWLGRANGTRQFLVETYDPARHPELRDLPELEPGDVGMHLLVAPTERPVPGFTAAVMREAVSFCLARGPRVVVEPDVRNHRIAALNAAAGFRVLRHVPLATKTAALSVCTRDDFAGSDLGGTP